MTNEPSIGGYEWSVTCSCGQTVNLAGLSNHPLIGYEDDPFPHRTRQIEGMTAFDCPNPDCNKSLRAGVEEI